LSIERFFDIIKKVYIIIFYGRMYGNGIKMEKNARRSKKKNYGCCLQSKFYYFIPFLRCIVWILFLWLIVLIFSSFGEVLMDLRVWPCFDINFGLNLFYILCFKSKKKYLFILHIPFFFIDILLFTFLWNWFYNWNHISRFFF